jgi:hypothetical protein
MYLLWSVSGIKQTVQRYIREDDLLGQALLREGKALWELLRCPRVHAGLPHPTTQVVFEQISGEGRSGVKRGLTGAGDRISAIIKQGDSDSPGATRKSRKESRRR